MLSPSTAAVVEVVEDVEEEAASDVASADQATLDVATAISLPPITVATEPASAVAS